MVTLGIIADTHIPDRARRMHPQVIPIFQKAGVQAILHAGDVSAPSVLAQLGTVAPVYAVRGNRDWIWLRRLPLEQRLSFAGVTIGLTHGHGNWRRYLVDRFYFTLHGYQHKHILPRIRRQFPDTKVIVFGHGHIPLNHWVNGQLLFNPGSPHFPEIKDLAPSVGLLHISTENESRGEIIELS